jgi:hypothetical protein
MPQGYDGQSGRKSDGWNASENDAQGKRAEGNHVHRNHAHGKHAQGKHAQGKHAQGNHPWNVRSIGNSRANSG